MDIKLVQQNYKVINNKKRVHTASKKMWHHPKVWLSTVKLLTIIYNNSNKNNGMISRFSKDMFCDS